MGKGTKNTYTIILAIILVASLAMLFFENVDALTGHVTESTTSNVTIRSFLAIEMSPMLDAGIVFEEVVSLPAVNQNAEHNYDDGPTNATGYYISVSPDGNRPVDFCSRLDRPLTDDISGATINASSETYSTNTTTSNSTIPALVEIPMSLTFNKTATNIPVGGNNYYRFWLDVPVAQEAGDYDNEFYVKGAVAGTTNALCDTI